MVVEAQERQKNEFVVIVGMFVILLSQQNVANVAASCAYGVDKRHNTPVRYG